MSTTMKAARVHTYGKKLQLDEVPIPQPEPDQVQISIVASGVCHTDLHVAQGDMKGNPTLPLIPGHEIVGRVAANGANVKKFKEGDIVGLPSLYWACGECDHCLSGWETLCKKQLSTGYAVDGGFAEYVCAPADFVVPIPSGVDLYEIAPILCAGVTTYKGLKQTGAKKGDWIVISGIGGLGHVAVQYAKLMGLRVVAVDIEADRLTLAEELGADLTINAQTEDAVARVHKEIGGAPSVLVTAASSSAFRSAVEMLRWGGICVLNGLPPGDFPLPICDFVLAGQTVRGSIIGTREDMAEAIEMAVGSNLRTSIEKQPLENINEIFLRLREGSVIGRVVLEISES